MSQNTDYLKYKMQNTSDYVNKIYDKMTYLDMYGSTVVLFIFITLFVFFVYTFFQAIQKKQALADDWTNQRCNPKYIPFAGFINAPEGSTAFQYTGENFQFCSQKIFVDIFGNALKPIEFMIAGLVNFFKMLLTSVNQIRFVLSSLRDNIAKFVTEIIRRISIVLIPLQSTMINVVELLNKIKAVMTASLYTVLGSYLTLKSLLGSIMEMIIKIMIIMTIIIAGLWAGGPFTWPIAAASSVAYLAFSITFSIILIFMSDVLHIKSSSLPKLRRCFDKNTPIKMVDGKMKPIKDIVVGDLLENGIKVTTKIKVDSSNLKMFRLKGIIVSETHVVKYKDKWIQIGEHPDSQEMFIGTYNEPFLYCLNTSSKEITINGITFSDWDELYGDELNNILRYISSEFDIINVNDRENIHRLLEKGFEYDTNVYLNDNTKRYIKYIKVGDKLSTNGTVYGIVEVLNPCKKDDKLYHLLVTNKCFETDFKIVRDYNDTIDSISMISKNY
jgi:hypothetical protein